MANEIEIVKQKEKEREIVLKAIYDLSEGTIEGYVYEGKIVERTELTTDVVKNAIAVLVGQGLVQTSGAWNHHDLTDKGLQKVEDSISGRNQGSYTSTPIFNFNAPVSSVQTGDNSTSNVFVLDVQELSRILSEVRNDLSSLPRTHLKST
jgi:predicted transcriptional regulator